MTSTRKHLRKLTQDQAQALRFEVQTEVLSIGEAAKKYGISKTAAWHIVKGLTYQESA